MVCCDTCPYSPTCEDLMPDDWGEEYPETIAGPYEDDDAA